MADSLAEALPPWNLVGSAYWFIYHSPSSTSLSTGTGYYDDDEQIAPDGSEGVFKGGLSTVMVVRYKESPVGPYDELIVVPGKFTNPLNRDTKMRISRIYVSTEASVINGRRNWNIPKQIARFKFTPTPPGGVKVEVSAPLKTGDKLFFAATVDPIKWAPTLPFRTRLSPIDLTLLQPPLHSLVDKDVSSLDVNPKALVGTDEWCTIFPDMRGRIRLTRCAPALGGGTDGIPLRYGDGVFFPNVKTWSVGVEWLDGMKLLFAVKGNVKRTVGAKAK